MVATSSGSVYSQEKAAAVPAVMPGTPSSRSLMGKP
jgi:hypothetical protein